MCQQELETCQQESARRQQELETVNAALREALTTKIEKEYHPLDQEVKKHETFV
jgi:hypothetical protein